MAYTFRHGETPLDGITIQRAIGRGGFGEVYYAVSDAGKQIALKYLREHPEIELRGVQHVMNITSPHLVKIFDVRRNDEDDIFVLMEYLSGPSLRDVLRAEPGPLAPEKAVFFAQGIAQGLSALHQRGVVHRDLKPGNIFYDDGYVKIGDYGLSKHMSVSQHSGQTVSVGTVHYMAPEIGTGRYTKQIDIYALGVILYEMLTGRLPFTGASVQEVLIRQMRDVPNISVLPAPFAPIVACALAKDPEERYGDVNEMTDALVRVDDIGERLSRFDPLTLTNVPRQAKAPSDPEVGALPAATLDARDLVDRLGQPNLEVPGPYRDRYLLSDPSDFTMPLYSATILVCLATLFAAASAAAGTHVDREGLAVVRVLISMLALLPKSILLYRWWATLPAGWRRTSPARAVGFCFLPIFNLYWFYVAFHGLVSDVNRYAWVFARDVGRLSHGWLIAFWIMALLLAPVTSVGGSLAVFFIAAVAMVQIVFMFKMSKACQALARRQASGRGLQPAAYVA